MKNGFIDHDFFKKRLCKSQLFVMCCAVVCIVLVLYVYKSNSHLTYQQDQDFLPQAYFRDDDTASKLDKVHNEAKQKVKLPDKPDVVNKNKISSQKDSNQQKATDQVNQNQTVPGMNATHINGTLMEPVNAKYTRNIYFTVKTTYKFYTKRIFPIMLTWLQLVDKNKLSIISDHSAPHNNYVDMFRRAGYQVEINNLCWDSHSRYGLCCKMATEFRTYYKAVEEHPGEEDRYQWFCHADDDVYINVPKLSHLLQQYDPHKPYYVGKWPQAFYEHPYCPVNNKTVNHFGHDMHVPLKRSTYQYATGSTFCISYTLMMKAKNFLIGINKISVQATPRLEDDMAIGFIIGALLGYDLTDVADMTNQYDDYVKNSTLNELTGYFTISSVTAATAVSLGKFASLLKTSLPSGDPTRFLLYHCLLYPTISWCNSVRETLNTKAYRKT